MIQVSAPKSLFVSLVYIPPRSDLTYYSTLFDFITTSTNQSEVVLLGDFNCPDINWSSVMASECSSRLLCDFVFDNDLCQLVELPTDTHGNTLDLVLVCSPDLVSDLHIHTNQLQFSFSNHYPITFSFHFPVSSDTHPSIQSFQYHRGDYEGLLLSFDFSSFFDSEDIDFLWERLKCVIYNACETFIPKSSRSNQYSRWFTGNIKHHIHLTHSLRKKAKNNPSVENVTYLEHSEVSLQGAISSARNQYEADLVNGCAFGDNRRIFQYINDTLKQHSLPDTMTLDSTSESSDIGKATLLNQFFHSVFSSPVPPLIPPLSPLLLVY